MKKIEKKINDGFTRATPNIIDGIASDCKSRPQEVAVKPARKTSWGWKFATAALALVLVVMSVMGIVDISAETASASTISLDVNPSVEIKLNGRQRVISVKAINSDGERIIGDMDFAGCQLKVAVNAIIGSMLRNGYLTEMANSVLVSVDANANDYKELADIVAEQITVTLKEMQIDASVLSQWIKNDDAVSKLASDYGISQGKAQLISRIAKVTNDYTTEQLVAMNVSDLSVLLNSLNVNLGDLDVDQSGSKAGIDLEKAKEIALACENLTVDSENVEIFEAKLDLGSVAVAYEVEFTYDNYAYEIKVSATTGRVLSYEKEYFGPMLRYDETAVVLDKEAVKAAALNDVKQDLTAEEVENLYASSSRYYRNTVHEISFKYNGVFYEYEIDSYGTVLMKAYKVLDLSGEGSYLARKDVEQWFIANNKDGFTALDKLSRFRVTVEKSKDTLFYLVTFVYKDTQYSYKIDAVNKTFIGGAEVADYEEAVKDDIKDKLHEIFGDEDFDALFENWDWSEWDWDDDGFECEFDHNGHHYEFEMDRWGNWEYERYPDDKPHRPDGEHGKVPFDYGW